MAPMGAGVLYYSILYFGNDTIPYNPATLRGTWDFTAFTTGALTFAPTGASVTNTQANNTSGVNKGAINFKLVSRPLEGCTISGTLNLVVGASESNLGANAYNKVHLFVTAGNTDTVRGTLLSNSVDVTSEFSASAAGVGRTGLALSSVTALRGDRLCLELGTNFNDSTSFSTTLYSGTTGTTLLSSGDTNVTTRPGYIQFSSSLPFRD